MREPPADTITFRALRTRFLGVLFPVRRLSGGLLWMAVAVLATLGLASMGNAQTFIRVPAPSVQQQDQSSVNAMPNPNGNAGANNVPQEAVLSDSGGVVKMVDQNGKPIGGGGWSLFHDWRPNFYLNINLTYDDNIFIEPHKVGDLITNIQPGIVLGWGDYRAELPQLGQFTHEYELPNNQLTVTKYLYLDYHPTFQIFASNSQENVVNESVLLSGSYDFSKLLVTSQFHYQTLSAVDIDVGGRINQTLYTGFLSGVYTVDNKTSLETIISSASVSYDGVFQDSVDTRDTSYFNRQLEPKTNVSAGFVVGYLTPELSPDEYYGQLLGRVRWTASDKFYLYATGGVELRSSSSGSDEVNGVFDLELNYAPFDSTRILLSGSRGTVATADEIGEDNLLTQVQLGVQQRLLGRLYASAGVGYGNNDYQFKTNSYRTDNNYSARLGLGMDVTQYAGIQLAGTVLRNDSTVNVRSFDDESVSLEVAFTY